MTTIIRAHFDGKHALILDEPADLPVGKPLRVHVEPIANPAQFTAEQLLSPVIIGLDPALAQAIANDPDMHAEDL